MYAGIRDNGFGLLFNWNLLGDGEHEVVALVDGVELDRATVTVTTLGAEFLREVTGTCTAADFPTGDETVTLAWQQTQQNFVIVDGMPPTGENRTGRPGVGYLENPGPNSFQSGIGVLSGWVCEGAEVVIELNGAPTAGGVWHGAARYAGSVCGDTANGFGLLFNWNLLDEGEHEVVAFVDGEELGRATVRVTTLGVEFLRGAEGECTVEDFPMLGETVTLGVATEQSEFRGYGRGVREYPLIVFLFIYFQPGHLDGFEFALARLLRVIAEVLQVGDPAEQIGKTDAQRIGIGLGFRRAARQYPQACPSIAS